jgi:hypothetical protein
MQLFSPNEAFEYIGKITLGSSRTLPIKAERLSLAPLPPPGEPHGFRSGAVALEKPEADTEGAIESEVG